MGMGKDGSSREEEPRRSPRLQTTMKAADRKEMISACAAWDFKQSEFLAHLFRHARATGFPYLTNRRQG